MHRSQSAKVGKLNNHEERNKMLTQKNLETLRIIGPQQLLIKLAARDGYPTDESEHPTKRLVSILGQKYFTKKAELKKIGLGINAYKKIKA